MATFSRSRFAAALQDFVGKRRMDGGLYHEIAEQLELPETGRILDIGTGTGWQLDVFHQMRPELELYGLDISQHSIRRAEKNLKELKPDLRIGSIENTSYDDETFDIVTCASSMSYWENLIACFNEIHRILKRGGAAILFEPQKGVDIDQVVETIRANLADTSKLRQFLAVKLNKYGLQSGNKLGLKLYSNEEIRERANQSRFAESVSVEAITLQNLPIFMCIRLTKMN